jgi:hypothetical protein
MMVGAPGEEATAMLLRLRPFPADAAAVVSGWATTDEEVLMWCGAAAAPVAAEQIGAGPVRTGSSRSGCTAASG